MYVLPNIGWIRPIDYPHQLSSETIKSTKIKTLLKFSAVAFCGSCQMYSNGNLHAK